MIGDPDLARLREQNRELRAELVDTFIELVSSVSLLVVLRTFNFLDSLLIKAGRRP